MSHAAALIAPAPSLLVGSPPVDLPSRLRLLVGAVRPVAYPEQYRSAHPSMEFAIHPPSRDFDQFFVEHYDDMCRSLTAAFGDADRVAEAVQDAFMRAYGRWRTVRRMDVPAAWVRRVAINRLRDLHRKAQRQMRAEQRAVDAGDAAIEAAAAPSSQIVEMLSGLPERQRTAMALYYVADLPVRDIALSMNISEGAVKAHLSQGRQRVAATLRPSGVTDDA